MGMKTGAKRFIGALMAAVLAAGPGAASARAAVRVAAPAPVPMGAVSASMAGAGIAPSLLSGLPGAGLTPLLGPHALPEVTLQGLAPAVLPSPIAAARAAAVAAVEKAAPLPTAVAVLKNASAVLSQASGSGVKVSAAAGRAVFDSAPVPGSQDFSAVSAGRLPGRRASGLSPAHLIPVLPLVYEAGRWARSRKAPAEPLAGGPKARAWEFAEVALTGAGAMLPAGFLLMLLGGTSVLPAAMAAASMLGAIGMTQHLSGLRAKVVGGWQASHDQKYRVGSDGKMRDVRGHKYGEDRYEEMAPGAVGPTARLLIRGAAALAGLLWLSGSGWVDLAVYNAVLTGFFIAADAYRRAHPKQVPQAQDAESRAHANRFIRRG